MAKVVLSLGRLLLGPPPGGLICLLGWARTKLHEVRAGVPCKVGDLNNIFALRSCLMTLQLSVIVGSLCPSVGRILDMDRTVLSSLARD